MQNMTLFIDPETRDLVFDEHGELMEIFDNETSEQNIRHTLLTWKKELFFDYSHGTDYDKIMGEKFDKLSKNEIESIFIEAIMQEKNVNSVNILDIIREQNSLKISFECELKNGEKIELEVAV